MSRTMSSAQRMMIASIQDLCIDITSCGGKYVAECNYAGHVNLLTVSTQSVDKLAIGDYSNEWQAQIYLPPSVLAKDTSRSLAQICVYLRELLAESEDKQKLSLAPKTTEQWYNHSTGVFS